MRLARLPKGPAGTRNADVAFCVIPQTWEFAGVRTISRNLLSKPLGGPYLLGCQGTQIWLTHDERRVVTTKTHLSRALVAATILAATVIGVTGPASAAPRQLCL